MMMSFTFLRDSPSQKYYLLHDPARFLNISLVNDDNIASIQFYHIVNGQEVLQLAPPPGIRCERIVMINGELQNLDNPYTNFGYIIFFPQNTKLYFNDTVIFTMTMQKQHAIWLRKTIIESEKELNLRIQREQLEGE